MRNFKVISVDKFIEDALYNKKTGYYFSQNPFGKDGDFITSPGISFLFSEMIAIWIIYFWEMLGKPKNFSFVELGPGNGSLCKTILNTFEKFPHFNKSTKVYLYEKSEKLIKVQKKLLRGRKVTWIKDFDTLKNYPVFFFGNEFFDAVPIKQFTFYKKDLFEKYYIINKQTGLNETYRKASLKDTEAIKSFKTFKNLKFIEYPKKGFYELDKIIEIISKLNGGIMLIDYGFLNQVNKSTLQTVMKNKKMNMNSLFKNLGRADITYLVNFSLLKEFFLKKKLKVKKIVSQKFFLEKMGIIQRAKILEKKMTQKQKEYMSSTLIRLLHKDLMGELFKVIYAFKSKKNNFLGFE